LDEFIAVVEFIEVLFRFALRSMIVSLPDVLLAGGGAFLIARNGWSWRGRVGALLLVIYMIAVVESFMGHTPPKMHPDDPATSGPVLALIAAALGIALGRVRRSASNA
jgi:hypothetical protein